MNEDDDLELLLGARFAGLERAQEYASAMERIARAESDVAQSSRRNATYSGPNARLASANAALSQARSQGVSGGTLQDLEYRQRLASRAVERMNAPSMSPAAQALYSTRFGMGGGAASPLVGKTMDAVLGPAMTRSILGSVATKLGPVAAIIGAGVEVGKALYSLSAASAQATNSLMGIRVATGGSTMDAARVQALGSIGASGQGARAFQERITGSDEGRSAAARIGMSNTRAPYGSMRFGQQYADAIQRTAAITDENQRQRLAYMLGIEEEVARYSRLSASSRRALERTAAATASINDPQQARNAAEFEANATRISQGWTNFTTAVGKMAFPVVSALQEEAAQFFNALAWVTDGLAKINEYTPVNLIAKLQKENMRFAADHSLVGPGSGGGMAQSATTQNTQATLALTAAIDKLTGNLGGGANAKDYLGSAQKAPFLHDALTAKAIRHGAMG